MMCVGACVLPCGALDVIRVVHLNGHVDEFSRPVSAREILTAHPGHVLSTPCSSNGGVAGRILIVSPESELKRGSFYFLIPSVSVPDKKKKSKAHKSSKPKDLKPVEQDKYLQDILSDKKVGGNRRKRSGRVGVWRPHLASITEDP
ncbi:uncharacterized protein A4U43_C07F6240 [Asparagus officinalis]|uniref:Uncharacterized protein n=1 Tax=Asparagus officinalis TaxID=4686 RepID=A0A5P1E9S6_ASPOF|nr:uncharacterized protein A4U43_C07F6240 [Asparagus officinalis]